MDSSDSGLLDRQVICERFGCGLPGEPVMVHSDIKGMTRGNHDGSRLEREVLSAAARADEHRDDRLDGMWLPGQMRILCDECFEAEYANMVETMEMMSRGELPYPLDDTYNL